MRNLQPQDPMTRQSKWAAAQAASGKCRQCGRIRGKRGTAQHCARCAKKHRERMSELMRKRREHTKKPADFGGCCRVQW